MSKSMTNLRKEMVCMIDAQLEEIEEYLNDNDINTACNELLKLVWTLKENLIEKIKVRFNTITNRKGYSTTFINRYYLEDLDGNKLVKKEVVLGKKCKLNFSKEVLEYVYNNRLYYDIQNIIDSAENKDEVKKYLEK